MSTAQWWAQQKQSKTNICHHWWLEPMKSSFPGGKKTLYIVLTIDVHMRTLVIFGLLLQTEKIPKNLQTEKILKICKQNKSPKNLQTEKIWNKPKKSAKRPNPPKNLLTEKSKKSANKKIWKKICKQKESANRKKTKIYKQKKSP